MSDLEEDLEALERDAEDQKERNRRAQLRIDRGRLNDARVRLRAGKAVIEPATWESFWIGKTFKIAATATHEFTFNEFLNITKVDEVHAWGELEGIELVKVVGPMILNVHGTFPLHLFRPSKTLQNIPILDGGHILRFHVKNTTHEEARVGLAISGLAKAGY